MPNTDDAVPARRVSRMTATTRAVLQVFVESLTHDLYGLEIVEETGIASGTVHPILGRLEEAGWLESRWEDVNSRKQGRPARRFYRLTEVGREYARAVVAKKARRTVAERRAGDVGMNDSIQHDEDPAESLPPGGRRWPFRTIEDRIRAIIHNAITDVTHAHCWVPGDVRDLAARQVVKSLTDHRLAVVDRDVLDKLVKVAAYVSAGRGYVDASGVPYPDASARFALGALPDDLRGVLCDGEGTAT